MEKFKDVESTVKPKSMEFDSVHVYINSNIVEVPENERESEKSMLAEGESLTPLYRYDVESYLKDEFLGALQTGQVSLTSRTSSIEDAILEISELVYQ